MFYNVQTTNLTFEPYGRTPGGRIDSTSKMSLINYFVGVLMLQHKPKHEDVG